MSCAAAKFRTAWLIQIEDAPMIIEFYGPPCSGKTTFSLALAARLKEHGVCAHSSLSVRPGEETAAGSGSVAKLTAAALRLGRPLKELALTAINSAGTSEAWWAAKALSSAYSNNQILRRLRMRQYLIRLGANWAQAEKANEIWLFDQAYLQAIVSIAVANPSITDAQLVDLIEIAPKSDLVVRIEAPSDEIHARLKRRHAQIGEIGVLLEDRSGGVREQHVATSRLDAMLINACRPVLTLNSGSAAAREAGMDIIMATIAQSFVETIGNKAKTQRTALCVPA